MTCVETPPSPTVAKTKQKPEPIPPEGMAIHGRIRGAGDTPTRTSDCRLCCATLSPSWSQPNPQRRPISAAVPLQNPRTVAGHRHACLRVPGTPWTICDKQFLSPRATAQRAPGRRPTRGRHLRLTQMGARFRGAERLERATTGPEAFSLMAATPNIDHHIGRLC